MKDSSDSDHSTGESSKDDHPSDQCDCQDKDHICNCRYGGNCLVAVAILVIIGIIIIGVYYWLSKYTRSHDLSSKEGLGKILSTIPGAGAGFWELTHLVLFGVLGFFFPTCDAIIISIGAAWEMIEHYLSLTLAPIKRPVTAGGYDETQWWYGSAVDIVVNIVGFYIGKSLRLLMLPPNPKNCEEDDACRSHNKKGRLCDGYHLPKFVEGDIDLLHFR